MQLLRRLSFTMLMMSLMTLVGCGGGDGGDLSGGGGGGTDPDPIVIALTKSDGDLSGTNDVTITATVTEGTSAVANKLVTFTLSDDTLASFTPESGTAVTNSSGVATIVVKATSIAGGVDVTATIEDVDPVSIGLTSAGGGTGGETDELSIVLSISNRDVSANNPSTVTAVVTEAGQVVADQLVTFTVDNTELASFLPSAGTANTNAEGIATITITAASKAGAGLITASIDGNALATTTFNSLGDGNDGGTPDVASLTLFASSQQLASSGAQSITLTAIAKDANNNLLAGVPVSFSADSGSLQLIVNGNEEPSNKTGIDGRVSMKLTTVAEPTNRMINISATSGSVSDSLEVEVLGTSVTFAGSSSLALNDENTFTIKVLNSDGTAIANTPVSLSLTNEPANPGEDVATITLPDSVTTGSDGQTSITVIGSTGGTNTIVASALGASTSHDVSVQSDSFLFTEFVECTVTTPESCGDEVNPSTEAAPDVLLSKKAKVTLTWLRNGTPVEDGTSVGFTSTRGSLSLENATTVDGKVTTTITSSNAGKALVTFTGTDTVNGKAIELNNQLEFEFVADTADRIVAQAYPASIGPNEQISTISVVLRDPEGNLVKNKTVKFELDDVSGGEINPATAVTDSNGSASTVYTSKSTSAHEGVIIKATVVGADPEVSDSVSLTVADREVFITLGTGNTILQTDINTYNKQYSVFVTDIDSNPVANTTLTVSAIPKEYWKSYWYKVEDEGEFIQYAPKYSDPLLPFGILCPNEDVNGNGILDPGEDTNTDGMLTPGNIVNAQGTVTTNANGHALIDIEYAEVYGYWANIELIVSTKVNGSESFARALFNLDVNSEDVTNEDVHPATFIGVNGPFGTIDNCNVPD